MSLKLQTQEKESKKIVFITYLRYLELLGQDLVFPKNAYQGDYVKEIAQGIIDKDGDAYVREVANVYKDVPEDVQYAEELDSEGNKVVLSGDKEKIEEISKKLDEQKCSIK